MSDHHYITETLLKVALNTITSHVLRYAKKSTDQNGNQTNVYKLDHGSPPLIHKYDSGFQHMYE